MSTKHVRPSKIYITQGVAYVRYNPGYSVRMEVPLQSVLSHTADRLESDVAKKGWRQHIGSRHITTDMP